MPFRRACRRVLALAPGLLELVDGHFGGTDVGRYSVEPPARMTIRARLQE
jgi:hypothetical protein